MDLMSTIATLDSHYLVLDNELQEINKDRAYLKELTKRYGSCWDKAMKQLNTLKAEKERHKKEITAVLNLFKMHLPAAKGLCRKLQRNGSNLVVQKVPSDQPDFMLTVDSAILANSTSNSQPPSDPHNTTVTLFRLPDGDSRQPRSISPPRHHR
eukprot:TRINITY_DN28855_c0_g1_i1.p1 TRINITY_DN28855_c0_g1~~TRINITY_DN28855_c0_g1_i1.p1  ORF type:complete len:154 (+),score=17.75 TRINITY_DN28855_c0_g1_i1:37-498(+)